MSVGLGGLRSKACDAQAPFASGSSSHESQPPKITWEWAPPTARGGRLWLGSVAAATPPHLESGRGGARVPRIDTGGGGAGAGCAAMPVRHRELGDELAPPEPKRCRHCDGTITYIALQRRTVTKTLHQTYLILGVLTSLLTNNSASETIKKLLLTTIY